METKEPTMRELRTLVECASRDNPHLTTRLEKAAFLVLLRRIVVVGHDRYKVAAEDGLRDYEVVNGHCECYDYVRHGAGHPCKHRLALAMYLKLQQSEEIPNGSDPSPLIDSISTSPTAVLLAQSCHAMGLTEFATITTP